MFEGAYHILRGSVGEPQVFFLRLRDRGRIVFRVIDGAIRDTFCVDVRNPLTEFKACLDVESPPNTNQVLRRPAAAGFRAFVFGLTAAAVISSSGIHALKTCEITDIVFGGRIVVGRIVGIVVGRIVGGCAGCLAVSKGVALSKIREDALARVLVTDVASRAIPDAVQMGTPPSHGRVVHALKQR